MLSSTFWDCLLLVCVNALTYINKLYDIILYYGNALQWGFDC